MIGGETIDELIKIGFLFIYIFIYLKKFWTCILILYCYSPRASHLISDNQFWLSYESGDQFWLPQWSPCSLRPGPGHRGDPGPVSRSCDRQTQWYLNTLPPSLATDNSRWGSHGHSWPPRAPSLVFVTCSMSPSKTEWPWQCSAGSPGQTDCRSTACGPSPPRHVTCY